jgi:NAD(P)-dependent dehydrogenase (short-subunit alcohol dehydrogenase family)
MKLIVTGAGGGIGSAVVRAAIESGHHVIASGRRAESLTELEALGAQTIAGDITDDTVRSALGQRASREGVDAVIATHGVTGAVALRELKSSVTRSIMTINALATIMLAEACGPALADAGGAFVATASQAGLRAERENSVYCASKWALVAWATQAQQDEAQRGFAIRAFCPGRTDAPMLHEANRRIAAAQGQTLDDYRQQVLRAMPLGRIGTPEEMASAALYLAAPAAAPRPAVLAVTGGEVPY